MLNVAHLSAGYPSNLALRDVSFHLQPGQLNCLLGPNGAGKSTLLKAMLGLIPVQQGSVQWGDRPLLQQRDRVAYVPQRNEVDWQFPITVRNVVLMGRTGQTGWLNRFSRYSRTVVEQALERVGMQDYAHCKIGELSGGQQQRVFLARALAQDPDIFFLDEPFNGIDRNTETILFDVLAQLKAAGKIVLVISHDLGDRLHNYDQFLLLNKTLIAVGDYEDVLNCCCLERAYGNVIRSLAA